MTIEDYAHPLYQPDWRTSRARAHPGCHFHLCIICEGAISGFYDHPCPAWENDDHVLGICYECWHIVKSDAVIETAAGTYRREEIHTTARWPADPVALHQHLRRRLATATTDKERQHWQRTVS